MALRRNSLIPGALLLAALASPAAAEDYAINYMSHSDSITIGLGDAPTSNVIIQHPTPWPSYVNNTNIPMPANQGISALENMMQRYLPSSGGSTSVGPTSGSGGSPDMTGAGVSTGSN